MSHSSPSIESLLSELRGLGIAVLADGENLRVSAPKNSMTAALRQQVADRKTELLAHLRHEAAQSATIRITQPEAGARTIPVVPRHPDQELPLSFAQQRLWFLDQLESGSTWNIPAALRMTGPLNRAALTHALNDLVARHEVLRTSFGKGRDGETPIQIIAPPALVALPVIDLEPLDPEQQQAEVRRWITQGEDYRFDLATGPLMWVHLLRLSDTAHLLLLTLHHIIADGWSVGVLIHEVAALYARHAGSPAPVALPELPIQYADFAVWQRGWLQEGELDRQLAYWQKTLTGAPALLELPTDRPRPAQQTFRGAVERFSFGPALTQGLRQLSRDNQTTLFMTLLGGFTVLLSRYSGQSDLVVGSPVANRNRAELEGLIGFFVNTLVLRLDLSREPTFRTLLQQIRQTTLDAYAHQDVPFEHLVERLKPTRTRSYSPLFQVMFILQNTPETRLELPEMTIHLQDQEQIPAKYDLLLGMEEHASGLKGEFEYNTDLFDPTTIQRMIGHLETVLHAAVHNPDQSCARMPLLTPGEYQLMVHDWNRSPCPEPETTCLHTLIEAQVARTPEAPALVFEGTTLSYHALNQQANQLAHHLIALGVQPGTLVGICLDRSLQTVIGVLAILKAGGAYVPMDPYHPPERLSLLIEDARLAFLVTQSPILARLPAHQARTILLDSEAETIRSRPATNPDTRVTPLHPTYVIYTSGSTGRPKGVVIRHDRLVRMFLVMREWYQFDARDVWSLFHAFSFDFSVWEMWGALLFGGRLVVVSRDTARSPEAFYELLHSERITILNNNPSVFQALTNLEESGHAKPLSLRLVIFGAEPLKLQNLKPWFDRHGDQTPQLINLYGITESTVHTTYHALSRADLEQPHLRIGPPRAELHPLYILDDHLQPVPIGVPGILYAGGIGLATGYLNQPELTAKAFLPDPFNPHPDSRLQRTGDLARFLPDGNIHFLGRKDYQVKVRGFRIELGEIEANLAQHPDLYEAAATTWEPQPGDKRLVAYVEVEKGHTPPTAAELRAYLKRKLPDYMVPALFQILEALPRSPNGKVDRRLLTPPASDDAPATPASQDPLRTPTEEMVAATWGALLNRPRVNRADHFFELGGHSLMATRVMARLRDLFALDLPLTLLFDHPTVADMSAQIDTARLQSNRMPPPPPIRIAAKDAALPLSFSQQRLWFLEQLEGGLATYHMPGAMALTGSLDANALERAIHAIIRRHESLRTTFQVIDGDPVQRILPPVDRPITRIPLPPGESVQQLGSAEMQKPFDLTRDFMLRATLIETGPQDHTLLFTFHHIAADGWSITIFISELIQLYNAFLQGQPDPLPPLPIQYADYSQWQRQWLQGPVLDTQLAYWKHHLADAPVLLELPTDRLRPPIQTYHGADAYFHVDPEIAQGIARLSRDTGTTVFMTLLAAFTTLLGRLSDQQDVIVGTPVANRNRPETEGLIGFFVNTLALRVDLSGDPAFRELLARVRRTTLDAFAHQDIPFEQLVEALQPTRNLSHAPLFQVLFALQNAPFTPLEMTGLTITPLDLYGKSAKFDISLSMEETDQGMTGNIEYNTDLFDAATIQRMIGHFKNLLASLVAQPELSLSRLPMLSAAERHQLLETWNDTHADYPNRHLCLHQLFEEQALRTPEATALVCDDGRSLSYAALNRKANQLAHHLRALGVGPDNLVGICLERNQELVIALLATLKAGGAYVPLDPNYPQDRIAFMLDDMQQGDTGAHGPVLLTQQSIRPQLPPTRARVISLDGPEAQTIAALSTDTPAPLATPDHLAYVIYTSGSTGRPKGVAIEHHSPVTLIHWTQGYYERAWFDQVLASTSICFDLSVFELFVPLSWGGTIVLVRDALALPAAVEAGHRITLINTVPSAMAALLRLGPLPESVKLIILAGEPFKDTLAHGIYANPSVLHFYNLYGPSEDTTYSTYARIPADLQGAPSIGRPIANTQAYILDHHLEPVPVGVVGELLLSGDGLARAYLNRPDLTAEKFIPNPFRPGTRLYKTGDLARYRPDGSIDFLGRRDHQVKVRGFRIELGEVENALQQHPDIRETVVLVRGDSNDSRYLAAYVVPRVSPGPTAGDLRAHLKKRVPDYMVPAIFVLMPDGLPLTANGKLDRKALPDPERSREGLETTLAAPRTHKERLLTRLWQEVLGVERVGIHDNFFELGGDSILSIQIVARARQAGVNLTLRQIFQHQTIAELALMADQTSAVQAEQGTITGPVPLTAIQRWFLDRHTPAPHHFNQSHLLVTPPHMSAPWLKVAVGQLLMWHDALRARFVYQGDVWHQEIAPPDDAIPFTVENLAARPPEQWQSTIEAHAERLQSTLDLTHGPLVRVVFFQGPDHQPGRLLFIIHHLVIDGVSWRILLEDLETAYEQAAQGQTVALPSKTSSFRQWAQRITAPAFLETLQPELDHWQPVATRSCAALPLDWPDNRSQNTVASVASIRVALDPEETNALLRTIPALFHTQINDLLLSALAQALRQWSRQDGPFRVDMEGHGREELFEDLDISRTVGWFTALFPILLDPGTPEAWPAGTLQKTTATLQATPRHGIGHGLLRHVQDTPLRATPNAELSFNYFGQYDAMLGESRLFTLAAESIGSTIAPHAPRSHILELNGFVTAGRMQWELSFSTALHRPETIQRLADLFVSALRQWVQQGLGPVAPVHTAPPEEWTGESLDPDELDALLDELN
ncbi:MAG: amino acid adenylation domain-containing protein [Magnetococcales bacterium]|nr:amino acid adenylation domain-containing protein [Magnetococcales bacterium]